MTVSTHTYSAVLLGSPTVALNVYDDSPGSFKLDAGAAPHARGSLTLNPPGLAVLTALTPTQSPPPRVQVNVNATFPSFSQSRSFDLSVRDFSVDEESGRVRLDLASDEALLDDYRALADDVTPLSHQGSLRGLINYILGQSITLRRNLALNPWPVNGGATADYAIRFGWARAFTGSEVVFTSQGGSQSSAGRGFDIRGNLDVAPSNTGDWVTLPVKKGDKIALGVRVKSSKAVTMTANVRLHDGTSWLAAAVAGSAVTLAAGVYQRATVGYTVPADGFLVFSVRANAGATYVDGDTITAQQLLIETNTLTPGNYFDGGSSPTAGTRYDGATNASTSRWAAALDASPSTDFPIPALSDSVNLIRNSKVASTTADWGITGSAAVNHAIGGGPAGVAANYYRAVPTAGATGVAIHIDENTVAMRPNTRYKLIAYVYAQSTQSVSLDGWVIDANGTVITSCAPATATPNGSWVKLVCEFVSPEASAKFRPRLSVNGAALALTVGLTAVRFSVDAGDPTDSDYYDGDTADTVSYQYDWSNTPNASNSTRTALVDAATPAALTWKAGQTALDFLAPLVQRFGLRLVCDEARVWTLRDASFTAAGLLSIRYGINMTAGEISISRDSGLWFDARVTKYIDTTPEGARIERVDSYAMNNPPTRVSYLEVNSAYPGPGRSQYAVQRAQGRGREVTVSTVSDWTAKAEQSVVAVPSIMSTQTGITQSITFDLGSDEMRVVTRTVDTPVGAIDLLVGTINGLTGTINGL